MKATSALRRLGEITESQWGMVTTAQACRHGINRMQLSRLADDGHLQRLGHGVYRDAGTPPDRLESLKVAWLSINPSLIADERLQATPLDAVVSGRTASHLLGLGDLVPEPYHFTVPTRRQTQRSELAFRTKQLPPQSLTLREGLPVTTPEQTIADLVDEGMDKSLVADVFADAASLDTGILTTLLAPLAKRNGFTAGDGASLYSELERLARRDVDSLAKVVANTQLAQKILQEYFKTAEVNLLPHLKTVTAYANSMIEAHEMNPVLRQLQESHQAIQRLSPVIAQLSQALPLITPVVTPEFLTALNHLREGLRKTTIPNLSIDPRIRTQLLEVAGRMRVELGRHHTIPTGESDNECED